MIIKALNGHFINTDHVATIWVQSDELSTLINARMAPCADEFDECLGVFDFPEEAKAITDTLGKEWGMETDYIDIAELKRDKHIKDIVFENYPETEGWKGADVHCYLPVGTCEVVKLTTINGRETVDVVTIHNTRAYNSLDDNMIAWRSVGGDE